MYTVISFLALLLSLVVSDQSFSLSDGYLVCVVCLNLSKVREYIYLCRLQIFSIQSLIAAIKLSNTLSFSLPLPLSLSPPSALPLSLFISTQMPSWMQ